MSDMKGKDKEKVKTTGKLDGSSEATSRKEVGVQDSPCLVAAQAAPVTVVGESVSSVLDKLVYAVDGVAGKIGNLETRLTSLEGQVRRPVSGEAIIVDSDEPTFGQQLGQGARPKIRKVRTVASDVEMVDSDIEKGKRKKRQDRKQTHTVKTMSQEYAQKLSKVADQTIIEKRNKPAESMTLADAGLLSQQDIEELGSIALDNPPQATQFWSVVDQTPGQQQKPGENDQRDFLDFLKLEQQGIGGVDVKPLEWGTQIQQQVQVQPMNKKKADDEWKKDPHVQALVAERMLQLEAECKVDNTQGKRKRSGRYNTTDSSASVPSRRWANEAVLVGPAKRRVIFDDLTETQFVMGFIKNAQDTLDTLMRQYMLLELYELLKLADSTSWSVARGAYIASMHDIEDGQITWMDRSTLLQRRMTHTHAAVFAGQSGKGSGARNTQGTFERRLTCKFHRAGNCREGADQHTDPMTGITYTHEQPSKRK